MRRHIEDYLSGGISRRSFVRRVTAAGFTLATAQSALRALEPVSQMGTPAAPGDARFIPATGQAGELVVKQLKEFGTKYLFVCNSSGMGPLADALVDQPDMHFIQAVSEHQTMAIADGYAKASGTTAFACFSRVGILSAPNMYNSMKDRTPIVAFTDHADTTSMGRDGHEDLDDFLEPFKQFTKWRWLVEDANRLPEWLVKAFKVSSMPPGGPTLLRVPRNLLYQNNVRTQLLSRQSIEVPMNVPPHPSLVERAAERLVACEQPVLYLGHQVWESGARPYVVELAELLGMPAAQARSWGADFPTNHPLYLGSYSARQRLPTQADLLLNLGAEPAAPGRASDVIHVSQDAEHIGGRFPTDIAIVANAKETTQALLQAVKAVATPQRLAAIRERRMANVQPVTQGLRDALQESLKVLWDQTPISWPRLLMSLNQAADEDAIIVTEVGTEDWVLRSFPFADDKKTRIGRTIGRALGWGVGASIGVQLAHPNRQVISLQGDGGFLFAQSDALWSMSRYDVPVITVIFNNYSYDETRNNMFSEGGRLAQEGKDMISYLGSPNVDFTLIAKAYGIDGEKVRGPQQLDAAIQRAMRVARGGRPFLLDVEIARTGWAAQSTWFPAFSVAKTRTSRV